MYLYLKIFVIQNLPPAQTPISRHSLRALETWLCNFGAKKSLSDPCLWGLSIPEWSAEIKFSKDELEVVWEKDQKIVKRSFPYGLSRIDVEEAIRQGP